MGSPFSNSTPVLENWCVFHKENNKNNFCLQEKTVKRLYKGGADGGGGGSGWRGTRQRMEGEGAADGGGGGSGCSA